MSAGTVTGKRRISRARGTRQCPLCGGTSTFAFAATDRNRRLTSETFDYHRCSRCATVFMVDIPVDLHRYYRGGYYQFDRNGEPAWREDASQLRVETWRVDALRHVVQAGTLIDVGAGAGGFAAAAHKNHFAVTAIEMDPECCQYMGHALGVTAICTDEPENALRSLKSARVVTLWHVLEHLREPGAMLAAATHALEPGGVLALGIPNPRSIQFRVLRQRWAHLDAPRHLCLMPASAILHKTGELGLEVVRITTSDPSGLACNLHGWVYAMRRDPSQGPASGLPAIAGGLLTSVLAPVERRGGRGAALTMFLRKREGLSG